MKTGKLLFIVSAVLLAASVITWFLKATTYTGPFVTLSFLTAAIAVRYFQKLKGFSYTILILTAVTVAMFYPQYFQAVGSFKLTGLIVPLLQIIMFGMGALLSMNDFVQVIKMPKGIIVGIICQFSIMPLLGFAIAKTFAFPPEIAVGVLLIGSSPSGLASNVMTFIAKGNLALSVSITSIATILAPILTPALMKLLASEYVQIDFWKMMLDIINMIILPIIAGLIFNIFSYGGRGVRNTTMQLASYFLIIVLKNYIQYETSALDPSEFGWNLLINITWFFIMPIIGGYLFRMIAKGRKEILDDMLSLVSMIGIGIIITIITAAGRDNLLQIGAILIVASLIHNIGGFILGYWGAYLFGMPERDRRTVAIEVGLQNAGLASGLALQLGKVATMGLAPAVFGPLMNITGSSLAMWWRGRSVEEPENNKSSASLNRNSAGKQVGNLP